jgi:hypothetical protein
LVSTDVKRSRRDVAVDHVLSVEKLERPCCVYRHRHSTCFSHKHAASAAGSAALRLGAPTARGCARWRWDSFFGGAKHVSDSAIRWLCEQHTENSTSAVRGFNGVASEQLHKVRVRQIGKNLHQLGQEHLVVGVAGGEHKRNLPRRKGEPLRQLMIGERASIRRVSTWLRRVGLPHQVLLKRDFAQEGRLVAAA